MGFLGLGVLGGFWGFRVWGFAVLWFWGSGVLGFSGFGVLGFWGFGSRVQGLGFRVRLVSSTFPHSEQVVPSTPQNQPKRTTPKSPELLEAMSG